MSVTAGNRSLFSRRYFCLRCYSITMCPSARDFAGMKADTTSLDKDFLRPISGNIMQKPVNKPKRHSEEFHLNPQGFIPVLFLTVCPGLQNLSHVPLSCCYLIHSPQRGHGRGRGQSPLALPSYPVIQRRVRMRVNIFQLISPRP